MTERMKRQGRMLIKAGLLLCLVMMAGCSSNPIYSTTGWVLKGYAEDEATPYFLQLSDPAMACAAGDALDPLVYSFSRVGHTPRKSGSLLMLLAGTCGVMQAWDAELRAIRFEQAGNITQASDARTEQERWLAIAAARRLQTYQRAMEAFEYDPGQEHAECPDFDNRQDELTFALGLLTGMQAVLNDAGAGVVAGVPRNIAPRAAIASRCLDNDDWAGMPQAIRAAVWLLLPDSKPISAPDPWKLLQQSNRMGLAQGIRVSSALMAVMAQTKGNTEMLAEAVKALAPGEDFTPSEQYRIVDAIAFRELLAVSDRYWTQHFGERTPRVQLGRLSKPKPMDNEALDDLL
ncbi:hypothetical protein QQM79_14220 [Marinobacteraceae bacterium S3BR75-40.1]